MFFTDYVRKCIWAMLPGTNGKPNPANVELFANIADPTNPNRSTGAVDLVESNTGDLWYVGLDTGEIHRISYTAANHPPVASFTATPSFGAAPLNVAFNASASSDPDAGDTLTYAWDLDGNGLYNDATGVSTSRTYGAGNVTVGLQVTDSHGATATTTRTIAPGNTPPTATITAPSAALTWKVGDPIAFSGSATDAQSGPLPASSLSWDVNLLTCDAAGSNCVVRSNQPFNGTSGSTVVAPDWSGEGNTLLEFKLTATDPTGLTDVKTVRLTPQKSTLTFQSNPSGLSLGYGSLVGTTPFTRTVIVGSNTSISAPSPQSLGGSSYQFTSWSDGGAGSHNLTVPATATTYTATYVNVGPANLVAAYGFEAGSGTSVLDSSGIGNTGVAANTTWSTAGKFGKALSFNGTNALVTVPDAASLDLTTGMTLEAWVNPTAAPAWGAVVAKETTGDQNYGVFATAGAGLPAGAIISGGSIFTAAGTAAAALNTWTHVATTYDGTNLRYYQNGVLVKTTAHSGAINVSTGVLHIGGDSSVDMFKGLIDEVRVYNTALSAAQITTDMNTPVVPADSQPPGAPGTLSATGGLGTAALSWGAASDNVGVVKYDVYRSTTSGFTPSVANRIAQPTGLTYNDTGLPAGTYYYRVAAEDAAGLVGPPTNEASAVVTADITAPTVTPDRTGRGHGVGQRNRLRDRDRQRRRRRRAVQSRRHHQHRRRRHHLALQRLVGQHRRHQRHPHPHRRRPRRRRQHHHLRARHRHRQQHRTRRPRRRIRVRGGFGDVGVGFVGDWEFGHGGEYDVVDGGQVREGVVVQRHERVGDGARCGLVGSDDGDDGRGVGESDGGDAVGWRGREGNDR